MSSVFSCFFYPCLSMTSNNITYATVYAEPTPLHEVSSFCVQFWHEALEPEGTNIQLTKAK